MRLGLIFLGKIFGKAVLYNLCVIWGIPVIPVGLINHETSKMLNYSISNGKSPPWRSGVWDSVLPLKGVWVRSVVRELRSRPHA